MENSGKNRMEYRERNLRILLEDVYKRQHMGFITSSIPFQNAKDRQRGLSEALSSKGLRLAEQDIFSVTPTLEEATRELTTLLSGRSELPTAMFAMNDILALSLIHI